MAYYSTIIQVLVSDQSCQFNYCIKQFTYLLCCFLRETWNWDET